MALPWRLAFCIGCGFFSEDFYPRDQRLQTTCVPESLSCQARSRNCNLAQDYLRLLPAVKKEDAPEAIRILSTPEKLSFLEKEKISLLELAAAVFEDENLKKAVMSKSIEEISEALSG